MVFEVISVIVLRQYVLKNYLWQTFLRANGERPRGVILPSSLSSTSVLLAINFRILDILDASTIFTHSAFT